jgi:hypothetical protein
MPKGFNAAGTTQHRTEITYPVAVGSRCRQVLTQVLPMASGQVGREPR